jgi:hypothetical protein
MNWIKLFENFREQTLEKEDIIDILQGTGINYSKIWEYPIRNQEDKEFYLGWIVKCRNPNDWVYPSPRNYQVNISGYRIEFQWKVKPDIDILLSKLTPDWIEIKTWLMDLFNDMEKKKSDNGFNFYKDDDFLFQHDLKNEYFWVSNNIWSIFESKYQIEYNQTKTFFWIILEHITNYKVVETNDYILSHLLQ